MIRLSDEKGLFRLVQKKRCIGLFPEHVLPLTQNVYKGVRLVREKVSKNLGIKDVRH